MVILSKQSTWIRDAGAKEQLFMRLVSSMSVYVIIIIIIINIIIIIVNIFFNIYCSHFHHTHEHQFIRDINSNTVSPRT